MLSEILAIIPKLDEKDLRKMEKSLTSRFAKIAKGFGKGIGAALAGGGIAAIGLSLVDKLLNPLKEVQEAIDKTLQTTDDLATNAKQFNTTTGQLLKLVTLAKASGLDQEGLFTLIAKFQTAVAQARANPNDPTVNSVKNFTGNQNTAEGFFSFITALQKMSKDQQVLVESQVFGEKSILKVSEFLNANFDKLGHTTGIDKVTSASASEKIDRAAGLSDLKSALDAGLEFRDLLAKSGKITADMVVSKNKADALEAQRVTDEISSYKNLAALAATAASINNLMSEGATQLAGLVAKITPLIDPLTKAISKFLGSPMAALFGKKDGQ